MTSGVDGMLSIGRFAISMETATVWVRAYTDAAANVASAAPYAYPAYDRYNADHNAPCVLSDADLLAPVLLNVPVAIRSFYGLQRVRELLERVLANEELAQPLADLPDERISDIIGSAYSVLDDPDTKPWGINGTTLSKVLHRKRPASVPLHDRWVRECYVGNEAPVPRANLRSWSKYMSLVAQAMAKDLRGQTSQFAVLQEESMAEPSLTDVRLVDILAWNVGQQARGSHAEESTNLP